MIWFEDGKREAVSGGQSASCDSADWLPGGFSLATTTFEEADRIIQSIESVLKRKKSTYDVSVVLEDVHLAHGAGAVFQQPRVDAHLVELVAARQQSHHVRRLVRLDAHGAAFGVAHLLLAKIKEKKKSKEKNKPTYHDSFGTRTWSHVGETRRTSRFPTRSLVVDDVIRTGCKNSRCRCV